MSSQDHTNSHSPKSPRVQSPEISLCTSPHPHPHSHSHSISEISNVSWMTIHNAQENITGSNVIESHHRPSSIESPLRSFAEGFGSTTLGWEPPASSLFQRRASQQKDLSSKPSRPNPPNPLPRLVMTSLQTNTNGMITSSPQSITSHHSNKSHSAGLINDINFYPDSRTGISRFTPSSAFSWNEHGDLVDIQTGHAYSIADDILKVQSPEPSESQSQLNFPSRTTNSSRTGGIVTIKSPSSLSIKSFRSQIPNLSPDYQINEPFNYTSEILASYNKHIKPDRLPGEANLDENMKSVQCVRHHSGGDPDQNVTNGPQRKSSLYKTELCRSWEEKGSCRYGPKCQFAHSMSELRPVNRHPKYKTEICKTFWENGTCPYGKRCVFIHTSTPSATEDKQNNIPLTATTRVAESAPGIVVMTKKEPDIIAPRGRRGSNDLGSQNTQNYSNAVPVSSVNSMMSDLSLSPQRSLSEIDLQTYHREAGRGAFHAIEELTTMSRHNLNMNMNMNMNTNTNNGFNLPPRFSMNSQFDRISPRSVSDFVSSNTSHASHASPSHTSHTSPGEIVESNGYLLNDLVGEMNHESSSSPSERHPPAQEYEYENNDGVIDNSIRRRPPPIGAERGSEQSQNQSRSSPGKEY